MQPRLPGFRPPLVVVDDYGAIGKGASNARSVRCENGSEYLLKGAGLSPDNLYVAPNEWIAAELARAMDLPILAHDVAEFGGELCFASQFMVSGTWYPSISRDLFTACINRDRAYGLVVLDAWICNSDRHSENLIVRTARGGGGETMMLNDHSHCLVQPGQIPNALAVLVDAPVHAYVTGLDFIREDISDIGNLASALDTAESIGDATIDGILDSAPPDWWRDSGDRGRYRGFLIGRRTRLRELFQADRPIFPNLPLGGGIP